MSTQKQSLKIDAAKEPDILGGAVPYRPDANGASASASRPTRRVRPVSAEALSSKPSHNYSLASLEDKHMPWGV